MEKFLMQYIFAPRITFFIQLVLFGIMASKVCERRKMFWLRFILCCCVLYPICFFAQKLKLLNIKLPFSLTTTTVLFAFVVHVLFVYKGKTKEYFFVSVTSLSAQHFTMCAIMLINKWTKFSRADNFYIYYLLYILYNSLCYLILYFLFFHRLKKIKTIHSTSLSLIVLMSATYLFTFVLQDYFSSLGYINDGYITMDMLLMFFVLFVLFMDLYRTNAYWEREMIEKIILNESQRYKLLEVSMEEINRKAHDLKYKLSTMEDNNEIREFGTYVDIYNHIAKTGNTILDNILTEKKLVL